MAQAELQRRGIDEATRKTYRLGYAPHSWDALGSFLAERGYSPRDAEEVGLIVPRRTGEGYYDRFRHRLMFPVSDHHGRIVAFSGRALEPVEADEREPPAKYLNSPETSLYKKSDILFGLHEARVELRRRDVAILCEGNFDVVSLAQYGFPHVVAPLGTAFTPQQAKLLRRFVTTAVLIFDADAAGRKAVRAAQPLLARAGIDGRVVTLPAGADPDSFLRERGKEALDSLIDGAPNIVEWLIEGAAQEAGADRRKKAEAIASLGPVLAAMDNPVEARLYVEHIAEAFEVRDIQAVRQQLRRGLRGGEQPRPVESASAKAPPRTRQPAAPLPELECRLVGAFLDHPQLHASDTTEKVHGLLTSDDLRAIFTLTAQWVGSRGVDATRLLLDIADDNPAREWLERRLAVQEFQEVADAERFIERAMVDLERRRVMQEKKRLSREILAARREGDEALANELMRQRVELDRTNPGRGPRGQANGSTDETASRAESKG